MLIDARLVVHYAGWIRYPARGHYVCSMIKGRFTYYYGGRFTYYYGR